MIGSISRFRFSLRLQRPKDSCPPGRPRPKPPQPKRSQVSGMGPLSDKAVEGGLTRRTALRLCCSVTTSSSRGGGAVRLPSLQHENTNCSFSVKKKKTNFLGGGDLRLDSKKACLHSNTQSGIPEIMINTEHADKEAPEDAETHDEGHFLWQTWTWSASHTIFSPASLDLSTNWQSNMAQRKPGTPTHP